MTHENALRRVSRSVLGAVKRPVWQAVYAATKHRLQTKTEYLDLGIYGGYFEADAKLVQERLPPGFEIIQHRPGFTEVEIWCAEYRHVDILQPYDELAVIVPVRFVPETMPPLEAVFVLEMPVTTEEARWGGVDVYGFPKIVADISIDHEGSHTRCQVRHRGVEVLSLSVEKREAKPFEQSTSLLNVRDDGHVIECAFELSGERSLGSRPGGVSLDLGHHAIAEELRHIRLRTASGRALYVPRASAVLGVGIDLGPLPPRTWSVVSRTSRAELPVETFPLMP